MSDSLQGASQSAGDVSEQWESSLMLTPVNVDRSHATGKPFVMAKENMILQDGQRKRSASTCQGMATESRCSQEGHESQLSILFPQPGHRGFHHPTWLLVSTNIGYTKRKNDCNT